MFYLQHNYEPEKMLHGEIRPRIVYNNVMLSKTR